VNATLRLQVPQMISLLSKDLSTKKTLLAVTTQTPADGRCYRQKLGYSWCCSGSGRSSWACRLDCGGPHGWSRTGLCHEGCELACSCKGLADCMRQSETRQQRQHQQTCVRPQLHFIVVAGCAVQLLTASVADTDNMQTSMQAWYCHNHVLCLAERPTWQSIASTLYSFGPQSSPCILATKSPIKAAI
jgi:hypothetical protein